MDRDIEEEQIKFYDHTADAMHALGLTSVRKCAEAVGYNPELVMATISNWVVERSGLPLHLEEALDVATGIFMIGFHLGMKVKEKAHAAKES